MPVLLSGLNIFMPYSSAAVDVVQSSSGLGWTFVNHPGNILLWLYVAYIVVGTSICFHILRLWLRKSRSKKFKNTAVTFLAVDGTLIFMGFFVDLIIPLFSTATVPLTNVLLIIFALGYWIIIIKL
jgi:hypothetical protein